MAELSFKPLANAVLLTSTNNNVYANGLVRICNYDTVAHTVNVGNSTSVYATFVVPAGQAAFVQKQYTDVLTSNATVSMEACPVRRGTI